jgi:putative ABC transport system permease protein
VIAASGVSSLPGGLMNTAAIRPEGTAPDQTVLVEFIFGDHDFLDVMGITLAAGRNFSRDFPTDSTEAFILNETAVNQFSWQDSPLEKRIQLGGWQGRVIGVVKDFHVKSLYQKIEPLLIHLAPNPDAYHYFAAKIKADNYQETIHFLEDKWKQVYPNDPFVYSFLDEDFDSQYRTEQLRGKIFISFSILAIFIACLGLFGLAAFTAEQRTKEIGIRKVLGASESGIVFRLSKEFAIWVLLANFIAWPVAFLAMDKWLQNFAYRTRIPMWIFFAAAVIALFIALITVSYQAIKAANSNPVEALRYE